MSPLSVAIVDDEALARHRLRRLLQKVGGGRVVIVLECVDADELLASAAASAVDIDVLFLDIEMPGGNAFEILRRWQGRKPDVIFVTAYASYGVRAFDARVVDYLLKPVSAERLGETLARLQERVSHGAPAVHERKVDRIPIQVGMRTHRVAISEIDAVVAQGNYIDVHVGGSTYTIRRSLASFASDLDADVFIRMHRSIIVRSSAIRSIKPLGSGRFRLDLQSGQSFSSGRSYAEQIRKLLSR